MAKLWKTAAAMVVCVLAVGNANAYGASDFYVNLLRRGSAHLDAGQNDAAVRELRIAAFGLVDDLAEYETAHVLLTIAASRMGDDATARRSVQRIIAAERTSHQYAALALPAITRLAFEQIATKWLTRDQLASLRGPRVPQPTPAAAPQPRLEQAAPAPEVAAAAPAPGGPSVAEQPRAIVPTREPVLPPPPGGDLEPQPAAATAPPPAAAQPVGVKPVTPKPQPTPPPVESPVAVAEEPKVETYVVPAPAIVPAPAPAVAAPEPAMPTPAVTPAPAPQPPPAPAAAAPEPVSPKPSPTPVPAPPPPPVVVPVPRPEPQPVQRPVEPAPAGPAQQPQPAEPERVAQSEGVEAKLAEATRLLNGLDPAAAVTVLRSFADESLSHSVAIRAGAAAARAGDYALALRFFDHGGAFAAGEEQYRYTYAVALYERGRYAEAKRELAAALPHIEVTRDVASYRAKIEGAIQ